VFTLIWRRLAGCQGQASQFGFADWAIYDGRPEQWKLPTSVVVASALAQSEAESGGSPPITAHPGHSRHLMRISAWNNDDMRGWFDLVSGSNAEPDPPTCRAFAKSG